jgi:hypothetical protein
MRGKMKSTDVGLQALQEEISLKTIYINKLKNLNLSKIRRRREIAKIFITIGIILVFIFIILFYINSRDSPNLYIPQIEALYIVAFYLLAYGIGTYFYPDYKKEHIDIKRYLNDPDELTNDILKEEREMAITWGKIEKLVVKEN